MLINVSIGEVIDKVSILLIKKERIIDIPKLINIQKELNELLNALLIIDFSIESEEFLKLRDINLNLWNIEEKIRAHEKNQNFNDKFISLARSVYTVNDKRATIKREINIKFDSDLIEVKSYC